jgi:hypothetical protein
VGQLEAQPLKVVHLHPDGVVHHIVVSGIHRALGHTLRDQVEVEPSISYTK